MRLALSVLPIAAACWLAPATAAACSPCYEQVLRRIAPGPDYPANGLVATNLADLPAEVAVTVDGAPASLVPDPLGFSVPSFKDWDPLTTWRISPTPPAGAQVVFTPIEPIEACFGEGEELPLAYQTGPVDWQPPAPPLALSHDLHVFPGEQIDATCTWVPGIVYWLHVDIQADDETSQWLRVEVTAKGDLLSLQHRVLAPGKHDIPIALMPEQLLKHKPTSVCLIVSTIDVAGHRSGEATLCGPCHVREDDPNGRPNPASPPQPNWTPDDLWSGGSCESVDAPPGEPGETPDTTGGEDTTGDDGTSGEPTTGEPDGITTSGTTDVLSSSGAASTGDDTGEPATGGSTGDDAGCGCRHARSHTLVWVLAALALRRPRRRAP
jgi:hypothetical protein